LLDVVPHQARLHDLLVLGSEAAAALSSALVEQVAGNMLASTHPVLDGDVAASKRVMKDSLHPHYHSVQNSHDEVTCEGARALWVTFDPRCQVHRSASLSFYSDKSMRVPIMTCSGDGCNFRPFVVHGDTVYFRFRAGNDEGASGWGYRFHVSPMEGLEWLSEEQVLSEPSLEWACWVLEYLLRDAQELVDQGVLHNAKVFNAMVQYLRARGTPFKHRVIALLTQLLKSPTLFPLHDLPDIASLRGIERCVMDHCLKRMSEERGAVVFPSRLLQLVELLTTARSAEKALKGEGVMVAASVMKHVSSDEMDVPTTPVSGLVDALFPPPVVSYPPKESRLSVSKRPLQDLLLEVMEIAECMFSRGRLPDGVICRMLLDVHGDATEITPASMTDAVKLMATWTPSMDAQLVQWVTALTSPRRREEVRKAAEAAAGSGGVSPITSTLTATSPLDISPADVLLSAEDQIVFHRLPVRVSWGSVCLCVMLWCPVVLYREACSVSN
jgi:hypothetical protein